MVEYVPPKEKINLLLLLFVVFINWFVFRFPFAPITCMWRSLFIIIDANTLTHTDIICVKCCNLCMTGNRFYFGFMYRGRYTRLCVCLTRNVIGGWVVNVTADYKRNFFRFIFKDILLSSTLVLLCSPFTILRLQMHFSVWNCGACQKMWVFTRQRRRWRRKTQKKRQNVEGFSK